METNLFNLPKDIINLLLNKYFDPISALRCLRTCKYLNILGDRSSIIHKVLMQRYEMNFQEQVKSLSLCPVCSISIPKTGLKQHLQKHEKANRNNKVLPVHNPFTLSKCYMCKGSKCNLIQHHCFPQPSYCYDTYGIFVFIDVLCVQNEWYTIDPNKKEHICYGRCKACKEIFSLVYPADNNINCGLSKHFEECKCRNEIIDIYRFKGDRTEEEWQNFLIEIKDKPNTKEEIFEKEYLEWKKSLPISENFVQKKYSVISFE